MLLPLVKTAVARCNVAANSASIQRSSIHLTSCLNKKVSGRHKPSIKQDKPLTYEEANPPDMIGVRKGINSINTSGFDESLRTAETAHEDLLIRKFVHGTWPKLLASDVIIKRRANVVILSFFAIRSVSPTKMYFLIGYTEEILSYILKCIVKIECQTLVDSSELIYKYI